MARNYTNMTVNPCKMCMPLGGVLAFKGIEGAMVILHGSQGCSTYIRRHMAAHYNEPVDIASSSLNEEGTVYGGAENLKKGIVNMEKLYSPKVIGVLTTCLAETIGEDTKRIVEELRKERSEVENLKICCCPTPGYGGTQYEGYFSALRNIVEELNGNEKKSTVDNGKINIILPPLSPGDVRNIKAIIENFTKEYILLPDISETLDGGFKPEYTRIPEGGTKIEDIQDMKNSKSTIEISIPVSDNISPGLYLREEYEVPLYSLKMPVGLYNCDEFLRTLANLTGKLVPEKYFKERGRLLDAMIDAHKYNAEVRAIIYGEPHQCLAITDAVLENGMKPVIVASGQNVELKNNSLFSYVKGDPMDQLENIANQEKTVLIDDTDFDTIEKLALEFKINMLIGSSDGRRIEEKHGIELIRYGFPIHDRLGGQRKIFTGYNGTMKFIDETSNAILAHTERNYRKEMYEEYYVKEGKQVEVNKVKTDKNIMQKTLEHPCYNGCASGMARMHLPVAPKCNVSCNYCNRKYDCVNESRPGVTSEVLSPEEALNKFKVVKEKVPNLKVIGIAGPGDALANFEVVKETFRLIRVEDKEITFCLSTNGLMLPFYANEIIEAGVTHVTVTINTIDPEIAGKIYREINYLGKRLSGREGAEILINNQLSGLKYLVERGVICKVNTVMVKGINDEKIPELVDTLKGCGVYIHNIMQMIPAPGSAFENMPLVTRKELDEMRKKCEVDIKQMYHCRQCRADAIGTLGQDRSIEFRCVGSKTESNIIPSDSSEEAIFIKIAVVSKNGINIDQHFGHAEAIYVYSSNGKETKFLEKRSVNKYCIGKEDCEEKEMMMDKIIDMLEDCSALIAMRIGESPKEKLEAKGIRVYQMYDTIGAAVKKVYLEGVRA